MFWKEISIIFFGGGSVLTVFERLFVVPMPGGGGSPGHLYLVDSPRGDSSGEHHPGRRLRLHNRRRGR